MSFFSCRHTRNQSPSHGRWCRGTPPPIPPGSSSRSQSNVLMARICQRVFRTGPTFNIWWPLGAAASPASARASRALSACSLLSPTMPQRWAVQWLGEADIGRKGGLPQAASVSRCPLTSAAAQNPGH
ncbi:hypothetical protein NDU88_009045 [Pleurodeles waltl]|uniref:Uncharacterized protein n=1 Tax=Pleurodeles waltl TaxID=8319 RepID=A0AAV7PRN1_PLEWA|nr:hypothetical protein NDU88_009045 [Pleurodeles waltl]